MYVGGSDDSRLVRSNSAYFVPRIAVTAFIRLRQIQLTASTTSVLGSEPCARRLSLGQLMIIVRRGPAGLVEELERGRNRNLVANQVSVILRVGSEP